MKPLPKTQADKDHENWFADQLDLALKEADDPDTAWVEHNEVRQEWENRRAGLVERIAKQGKTA